MDQNTQILCKGILKSKWDWKIHSKTWAQKFSRNTFSRCYLLWSWSVRMNIINSSHKTLAYQQLHKDELYRYWSQNKSLGFAFLSSFPSVSSHAHRPKCITDKMTCSGDLSDKSPIEILTGLLLYRFLIIIPSDNML